DANVLADVPPGSAHKDSASYNEGDDMNARNATVPILVALLAVLALASSAWAECAWLMWQQRVAVDAHGKVKQPWEPLPNQYDLMSAFQDQRTCERAIAAAGLKAKDVLICLPDNVDPRRPKPEPAMKSHTEQERRTLLKTLHPPAPVL